MIALKVEKIGDRIAVVLTEEALAQLNLSVGDVLHVEPAANGAVQAVTRETWIEVPHARGRAFLRRYNKSFERFEG
jgi:hypothetical protein